jgi:hypothetical protein
MVGWELLLVQVQLLGSLLICEAQQEAIGDGPRFLISHGNNNNDDCLPCHIVHPEILVELIEVRGDSIENDLTFLQCITKRPEHSYRESFDIQLPETYTQLYRQVISAGDAFICIQGGYIDEQNGLVTAPTNSDGDIEFYDMHAVYQYRQLQQSQDQSSNRQLRLLAVRVIDSTGHEPIETKAAIEGAIYGTGSNPDNISSSASVVQQFGAISHNQLTFTASVGEKIQYGVAEVPISISVNGSLFFRELVPSLLNATALTLGPMDEIADVIIFCLPDGSLLDGQASWTGLAVNGEPVR